MDEVLFALLFLLSHSFISLLVPTNLELESEHTTFKLYLDRAGPP